MTVEQLLVLSGMVLGGVAYGALVLNLLLGEPFGNVDVSYIHASMLVALISMIRGWKLVEK